MENANLLYAIPVSGRLFTPCFTRRSNLFKKRKGLITSVYMRLLDSWLRSVSAEYGSLPATCLVHGGGPTIPYLRIIISTLGQMHGVKVPSLSARK